MAASMSLAPSRAAAAAAAPARRVRARAAAAGMPSAEDGYRTLMASEAKQKLPMEWEDLPLPLNTYSNEKPFTGEVVSNERCVGPKATGELDRAGEEHTKAVKEKEIDAALLAQLQED